MISVGLTVQDEAAKQFQELGTDILNIRLGDTASGSGRRARAPIGLDAFRGLAGLSTIDAAAPYMTFNGQAFPDRKAPMKLDLLGVTAAFADLNKLRLEDGRFISDLDHRRYFCVIGTRLAAAMRGNGSRRIVGSTVRIEDNIYTVVGVLQRTPRGQRRFSVDRAALNPATTARRVFSGRGIRDITARMSPNAHHLAATAEVKAWFRGKSRNLDVRVRSAEQLIEQMQKQMRLFTLLLGGVGGISLLVGGIGVMNVTLVSVAERRPEIGVRRALGARRRDIQSQFLIESVILSLLGGVLGTALGVAATYAICHMSGWTFRASPSAMGLGPGVSAATGVFFGFYPAWQAAGSIPWPLCAGGRGANPTAGKGRASPGRRARRRRHRAGQSGCRQGVRHPSERAGHGSMLGLRSQPLPARHQQVEQD